MANSLKKSAKILFPSANTHAIGLFVPLLDEFPDFRQFSVGDWDFFATVGAVHSAILTLREAAGSSVRFAKYMSYIRDDLKEWDDQGETALEDCAKFVLDTTRALFEVDPTSSRLIADGTGLWLLHNLYKRQPTYEEAATSRIIGAAVIHPFENWWTSL